MNRGSLANAVGLRLRVSRRRSIQIVDAFFDLIEDSLRAGEDVAIRGFGRFYTSQSRGFTTTNPQGEGSLEVEPHQVVRFKPSRSFTRHVRLGDSDV